MHLSISVVVRFIMYWTLEFDRHIVSGTCHCGYMPFFWEGTHDIF
jgi:hypothetical protein